MLSIRIDIMIKTRVLMKLVCVWKVAVVYFVVYRLIRPKSLGSQPRSVIKNEIWKYFFVDHLSANFWQKLWEQNQIAMKKFFKNLSFGVDVKL